MFLCSPDLLLALRRLVDEIHKLVELRSDDNLGAAVALLAHLGVIAGHGVILSTTTGSKTLGRYTKSVLQILYR